MVAIKNTGTSIEIKEQYENMKSLSGGKFFIFPPLRIGKTKAKDD